MRDGYIIGIDGGTQSSKVSIFDLEGNAVSNATVPLQPIHMPSPGVAIHPDDDLWESVVRASRKALEGFTGRKEDILAVGLGSIRCCRADLKDDGTLAYPVLSWMDVRLSRPYEHVHPEVARVTTTTGYLTHRFTGEFRDTAANYEGPWPLDKDTWNWSEDPAILEKWNIPQDMLFELHPPGDILGHVTGEASGLTGIPAGIPVVATANDKAVEALGAGLKEGPEALISLGTYIGGMVYGSENRKGARSYFSNLAAVPGHYLYESGGIRQGMWIISWFLKNLCPDLVRKAEENGCSAEELATGEAENVPAGCEGLMTIPEWLAPPTQPFKRGAMVGFNSRHTRGHMYRSFLEAIALTMKNHSDAMYAELGKKIDSVIISGGGSNSDLFMQIFADVFNVPTLRNRENSSAGIGAAICAAVAVGAYDTYETAVDRMVRIEDTFEPIAFNAGVYEKMNTRAYRDLTGHTDAIFQKTHTIFT